MQGRFKEYFKFGRFDNRNNDKISDLIKKSDIELPGKSISFSNIADMDDEHLLLDDQPKTTTKQQLIYDFKCYNRRKYRLYHKLISQPIIKEQSEYTNEVTAEIISDIHDLNKMKWNIVIRCTGIIYSFILKMNYSDDGNVEQDCFCKMYRIVDRLDISLGFSPSTYIINSLYRTLGRNSKIENARLYRFRHVDDMDGFHSYDEDCRIDAIDKHNISEIVWNILNKECGERTVRAFDMRYNSEMTFKEIGKNLGVSTERARQIIFSGINLVKAIIGDTIRF